MTIWTMEQVQQVRGLRIAMYVSDEALQRDHGDLVATARRQMARQLVAMARPFAVEVDPDDITLLSETGRMDLRLSCRWEPSTNAAILVGGPRDGERWAIQKVGEPLVMESLQSLPWLDQNATDGESIVHVDRVRYELAGWHEVERCWVYQAQA